MGFELRASHFLHRCSTTWATPSTLFCFIFQVGSYILLSTSMGPQSFYLQPPAQLGSQPCTIILCLLI
jgi:hypothetical protein